jgi:hypothetical protein
MYDDVSSYHSHSLGNLSTVILTRTNAVFLFSLHAAQAVILIFICCTSYIFKLLSWFGATMIFPAFPLPTLLHSKRFEFYIANFCWR